MPVSTVFFGDLTATATPIFTSTPALEQGLPADSLLLARLLVLPADVTGTTQTATVEALEPTAGCADGTAIGRTVWAVVVPATSGVFVASTEGSDFDTVLSLYSGGDRSGDPSSLRREGCNDDENYFAGKRTSRLEVAVNAGSTYHLQLGGYGDEGGRFHLTAWLDGSRTRPAETAVPAATARPDERATNTPYPTPVALTLATPEAVATALPAVTGSPFVLDALATQTSAVPSLFGSGGGSAPESVPLSGVPPLGVAGAPAAVRVLTAEPSTTRFALAAAQGVEGAAGPLPDPPALSVTLDAATLSALSVLYPSVTSARLLFDPDPALEDERHRGKLGGEVVVPVGKPFDLQIELRDAAGTTVPLAAAAASPDVGAAAGPETGLVPAVRIELPVLAHHLPAGRTFVWLYSVEMSGEFAGYVRAEATYDPPADTLAFRMPLEALQGTLFLPAVLVQAWVQTADPDVHLYSGPTPDALDYGLAGPPLSVFSVVGPQVGGRLFVYSPASGNYAWVDAAGVEPVSSPQ